jgi:hydrogenase maturation protein HypF
MQPVDVPVLACGALLKNTFCVAHRDQAWFGPHIGDLENAETFDAYQDAITRMERFLGIRGEIIAHDLHPDYLSTRYALERGDVAVGVQHHHAHIAAAIAEHGLEGPVVGVAFDGTGYGTDGTAWGGEFLLGDTRTVRRVATFRPIPLAGGDTAVRHPWRIALALLRDAFGEGTSVRALKLFDRIPAPDLNGVRRMLAAGVNAPLARGVGRYFDGIGALVLARAEARYEGQLAFELNMAADPAEQGRYDYDLDRAGAVPEVDFRHVVKMVVRDLLAHVDPRVIAARFHNTLIAATAAVAIDAARELGSEERAQIVLSGGCFQNARLAEGVHALLASRHDVFLHRAVPPGDGGLALGQAAVAAARLRG